MLVIPAKTSGTEDVHFTYIHDITAANSTGEAVVQYFSGQTDVQNDSCGSFVRVENDNSRLAGDCDQWGYYRISASGVGDEIKTDCTFNFGMG